MDSIFLTLIHNKITSPEAVVRRCSVKKGVLRNFTNSQIHRKTPVPGSLVQVFSCEFCEISKNTFSTEHLGTIASVCLS